MIFKALACIEVGSDRSESGDVAPGVRALDLCCGTGDISFALAQRGAEE